MFENISGSFFKKREKKEAESWRRREPPCSATGSRMHRRKYGKVMMWWLPHSGRVFYSYPCLVFEHRFKHTRAPPWLKCAEQFKYIRWAAIWFQEKGDENKTRDYHYCEHLWNIFQPIVTERKSLQPVFPDIYSNTRWKFLVEISGAVVALSSGANNPPPSTLLQPCYYVIRTRHQKKRKATF